MLAKCVGKCLLATAASPSGLQLEPGKPQHPVLAPAPLCQAGITLLGLMSLLLPCAKTSQESSLGCHNLGKRVASSEKSSVVRAGMCMLGKNVVEAAGHLSAGEQLPPNTTKFCSRPVSRISRAICFLHQSVISTSHTIPR